jgi:hypothetical protein
MNDWRPVVRGEGVKEWHRLDVAVGVGDAQDASGDDVGAGCRVDQEIVANEFQSEGASGVYVQEIRALGIVLDFVSCVDVEVKVHTALQSRCLLSCRTRWRGKGSGTAFRARGREAGIQPATISWLWSASVASEVVIFLLVGPRLIARIGPVAATGVLRWTVAGLTTDVMALALMQPLHGLTFALLHLAAMRLISGSACRRR